MEAEARIRGIEGGGSGGPDGRPTEGERLAGRLLSRREFVAGSAALVAASALGLARCGSSASPPPAGPPRWIAVSTAGLRTGEPRWVEFEVPAAVGAGAPATSSGPRPKPVSPAGTPADSLPGGRGGAWLSLQPDGTLLALGPLCTHKGCLYDWEESASQFRCRCHPGLFRPDGSVISGPPPRPLVRFPTRQTSPSVIEIGWVATG